MAKRNHGAVSWWQTHRPTTRRLVQLYAALLHNAHIRGFIEGKIYEGKGKYVCVPGLNCYSCPGAAGACPLGAVQNALAGAGHRAGWYVLGILLLFGVVLGRTICGWLCPMGLIQELLYKIPVPKIRKSRFTRVLSRLKYVILAVFAVAIPLWFGLSENLPVPGFCKYICPAGTLEGAAGHLANPANASMYSMLGVLFTRKWVIMLAIALACVFCFRSFCRFICPLGAVYSLFSRFSIIGVKVDGNRCSGCGACVRHCRMDVKRVGDHECIHCGKCMEVCGRGAISLKAGKVIVKGPETDPDSGTDPVRRRFQGRFLRGAALVALCAVLVWFNFLDPSIRKNELPDTRPVTAETGGVWESSAPVGFGTGEQLADFTLTCYDGSEFHLADTRGKVTIINRWATWCTPCREELPYFNELYQVHGNDIAMIAVHPSMIVEDPESALEGFGFTMPFATDTEEDTVRTIVGGTGTLPQTVVLNRRGEVIYNSEGSVTPELLEALYRKASEQE